jgi:hypothetical protein
MEKHEFICPSLKVVDFNEKRASVVRGEKHKCRENASAGKHEYSFRINFNPLWDIITSLNILWITANMCIVQDSNEAPLLLMFFDL